MKKNIRALFFFAVAVLLVGCTSSSTSFDLNAGVTEKVINLDDLQTIYSKLDKTKGKVFALNPALSSIRIYAFRGGSAPTLGHNHVLTAPNFTGYAFLPHKGLSDARFDLEFRLDQLEMDNPAERSKLGEEYASVPTPDAIKRTRDHMLGEDNFQASRFPFVRIHSVQVAGEKPIFAIEVQVELHGQQKIILMPLTVEVLPDHLSATGTFVIRQTDFGVKPYSVLGGFLAMQDEVVIEFKLVGN